VNLARRQEQIIVSIVVEAHADEALGENLVDHELADDLQNDRAQEPVSVLIGLRVDI
jgi:hypothetical protein